MSYPCPCCGYLTFEEMPPGTFDICPVCRWEDDNVQFNEPDYAGGANKISLNEARRNFVLFGAKSKEFIGKTRKPMPEEIPST